MALEMELDAFRQGWPGWVAGGKLGQWVVIHGGDVIGFYPTLDAALEAGYDRLGLDESFMARQVTASEHPIPSARRAVDVHPQR